MNIHYKLICNLNLIKRDITINSVTDPDLLISSLAWEGGKVGRGGRKKVIRCMRQGAEIQLDS